MLPVLALAACSVARPQVVAREARVAETGTATTRLDIVLDLTNAGETDVELVTYDYLLTLSDGSSYGGRWAALRALPPRQTVRAVIPAILPSASAREGVRWSLGGHVSYRDPQSIARILYEAGILRTEVGFSGAGAVPTAASAAR